MTTPSKAAKYSTVREILLSLNEVEKEVVECAITIYEQKLSHLKDLLKRLNLAYLSLIEAYKTMGIPINESVVEKHFSISKEQIKKTLKVASRNGYELIIHRYSPLDFIKEYSRLVGIHTDHLEAISDICTKLLLYKPRNNEIKPQNIAAAVVFYYATEIKGFVFKIDEFVKQTGVSKSSMELIKKEVIQADK